MAQKSSFVPAAHGDPGKVEGGGFECALHFGWSIMDAVRRHRHEREKEDGLKEILAKLDRQWQYDQRVETPGIFDAFFFRVQRRPGQTLLEYVTEFHQALRDVQRLKVNLPEEISGWLLLRRAALSREQQHLIQSQIGASLTLTAVEQSLFLVFGQDYKHTSLPSQARGRQQNPRQMVHHAADEEDPQDFEDFENEEIYYEYEELRWAMGRSRRALRWGSLWKWRWPRRVHFWCWRVRSGLCYVCRCEAAHAAAQSGRVVDSILWSPSSMARMQQLALPVPQTASPQEVGVRRTRVDLRRERVSPIEVHGLLEKVRIPRLEQSRFLAVMFASGAGNPVIERWTARIRQSQVHHPVLVARNVSLTWIRWSTWSTARNPRRRWPWSMRMSSMSLKKPTPKASLWFEQAVGWQKTQTCACRIKELPLSLQAPSTSFAISSGWRVSSFPWTR